MHRPQLQPWLAINESAPAIEVCELSKTYARSSRNPVTALSNISLTVAPGTFLGLLGPNGAGKSTLIRTLCGLVRIESGTVRVFGHDCSSDAVNARRMIGLSPQDPNLDRFLTVRETLRYHGGYFGLARRDALEKADELIDRFELNDKANVKPTRLSGGMKRRLLLARAFMHDPPLLVLDEPTAGVDVELRHQLWKYIRELHAAGRTILLTTHYLEEAEQLCDDIALISRGNIVARGTPSALIESYDKTSLEGVYLELVEAERAGGSE